MLSVVGDVSVHSRTSVVTSLIPRMAQSLGGVLSVVGDVSVHSRTSVVTSSILRMAQSLGGAHRSKVTCVFVSVCVCIMFLKNNTIITTVNTLGRRTVHGWWLPPAGARKPKRRHSMIAGQHPEALVTRRASRARGTGGAAGGGGCRCRVPT